MILCLPFMMFQGRAQEAIDLYLSTFPDAKLLEIMHHPEGTEIFDPEASNGGGTNSETADHSPAASRTTPPQWKPWSTGTRPSWPLPSCR